MACPAEPQQADDRGDQHDPALLGPQHAAVGALDHPEGAGEVGVEDGGEVLLGHAHQQLVAGDAGVGDQHLDVAVLRLDLLVGLLDLLGVGDVAAHGEHAERHEVGRRLARAVGDGDLVARVGEGAGDGEADAPVSSGDENRAAQRITPQS